MKLKRGLIYYFEYGRWHEDPYPLALVLYAGDTLVHCLNLHYLDGQLNDDLIAMITKIALGKLDARDQYKFYHSYMKRRMPGVIKNAYRTYKPGYIRNVVVVSNGFEITQAFLEKLRKFAKVKHLTKKKIETQIKKEVKAVGETKRSPEELERIQKLTKPQIHKNVLNYMREIKKIVQERIDKQKAKMIKGKR